MGIDHTTPNVLHSQEVIVPLEGEHSGHIQELVNSALGAVGIGALVLSPYALDRLGVGSQYLDFLGDFNCCPLIRNSWNRWGLAHKLPKTKLHEETYGISGATAAMLSHLPNVGQPFRDMDPEHPALKSITNKLGDFFDMGFTLREGQLSNAIASGGIIVAGHYAGSGIQELERQAGGNGMIGGAVQTLSQLFGVVVALPAILPGIGHAIQFLSAVVGLDTVDMRRLEANGPGSVITALLGKAPGSCTANKKLDYSAYSAASLPLAAACCAIPAIIGSLPFIFSRFKRHQETDLSDQSLSGICGYHDSIAELQLRDMNSLEIMRNKVSHHIDRLKNQPPNLFARAATAATGIATGLLAFMGQRQTYLKRQQEIIAEREEDIITAKKAEEEGSDVAATLKFNAARRNFWQVADLETEPPDDHALAWNCAGCQGCGQMEGCYPTYIPKNRAIDSSHPDYKTYRRDLVAARRDGIHFGFNPNSANNEEQRIGTEYLANREAGKLNHWNQQHNIYDGSREYEGAPKADTTEIKPGELEARRDEAVVIQKRQQVFSVASSIGIGAGIFGLMNHLLGRGNRQDIKQLSRDLMLIDAVIAERQPLHTTQDHDITDAAMKQRHQFATEAVAA